MYEALTYGLLDELDKIAEAKYRTAIAAHEMGHARDYETSSVPRLRTALRALGPLAGTIGGLVLAHKGHRGLGALAAGAGFVPMLADEAIASFKGMKTLRERKKFTPEQLSGMRNQLLKAFGTYAATTAGVAGAVAAAGTKMPHEIPMLAGGLTALGLGAHMAATLEDTPKENMKSLDQMRKGMGVKAGIYERQVLPHEGLGGRWSELGAFYTQPLKSKIMRVLAEKELGDMIKNQKKLDKVIAEGGVVLPRAVK